MTNHALISDSGFDRETRFGLESPNRVRRLFELSAIAEAVLLLPAIPWLLSRYHGDGRQIMVLPGFRTDDRSTGPLRWFLRRLGYDAVPWGLGRNTGQPDVDAGRVLAKLQAVRWNDEPITLIGWSLGGVIAREVARQAPDIVREVITLGTPVEGGPKYTAGASVFAEEKNIDLDELERHIHSLNSEGVEQPLTVIYSRSDGIVDWRAAIDRYNPQARHIRVLASHLGMGVNPWVWGRIAKTLAADFLERA